MRTAWPLLAGIGALAVGTAVGWIPGTVDLLVTPPAIVRAALVAASLILGLWLVSLAVGRIGAAQGADPALRVEDPASPVATPGERDLAGLVRGVRLVFLAVAAFAAAGGWLVGSGLPLVVALVIAGVDVVETTFLLLVVAVRRPGSAGR